jgi:HNH endonuclease
MLGMTTQLDIVRNDHIATLRTSLVNLCSQNYCAAMILDEFYYNAMRHRIVLEHESEDRYNRNRTRYKDKKDIQIDHPLTVEIPQLKSMMSGMFDEQFIITALAVLSDNNYASIEIVNNLFVSYEVNLDKIELDLLNMQGIEPLPPSTKKVDPLPTIEKVAVTQPPARRSESRRIEYHNNRAARIGLPATLTLAQWKTTLAYFQDRCALCPDGAYEVLEHFIPLIQGGGTTEYNCIPACAQCNRIKHDAHPSMISEDSPLFSSMKTVQAYLETRRVEA